MKAIHKKIGLVSGIGPLAGADVLTKLFHNAAKYYGTVQDNEYPDVVLENHGIDGVDNTASLNDEFKQEIISMVKQVESHGANIIGIACNTAHVYFGDIKTDSETSIVNLIDAVAMAASQYRGKKYVLLTSAASRQQKLYHGYLKKYGVQFAETTNSQQEWLDQAIGLVMAGKLGTAGKLLEKVFASAKKQGLDAVIAGCTELPIAIDYCQNTHRLAVIDSNDELAKALLREYYA